MENTLENFSKTVLDKLEHVKCPICLDIVENVRELPCRHIFCFNCLETYKKNKDSLECPLCKKEISKRKMLSRDAALESLCSFVRALGVDIKVHHKTDIKTFFANVSKGKAKNNMLTSKISSDEFIKESSEENIIPCTIKPNNSKGSSKKKALNDSKFKSKTVLKPITPNTRKNLIEDQKKIPKPKIGLSRKQKKVNAESSDNLAQQLLILPNVQNLNQPFKNKNKILQWLQDSRNKFERLSQTQSFSTQTNTPLDIDMLSVSQVYFKNRNKDKKSETVQNKPLVAKDNEEIRERKVRSVENSPLGKRKNLRRHSLECTSPNKIKQYQNLQEMNCIENQLIINIMEDEVLDAIDKEVSGENSKKKTAFSSKSKEKTTGINTMNLDEDKFLDQLDHEMLEVSDEGLKKNSSKQTLNATVNHESKSKSSWKSIKKLKKTIGKTKVPKKLDISLQSTQKSIRKDGEPKLNTSDPLKTANSSVMETKAVDFQKMEDYFSKALPEMIKMNIPPSSQEIITDENIFHQNSKQTVEPEKDNDSDIYIYQTQPLTKEPIDPKIDKIGYAAKLTSKLKDILLQLTEEDNMKAEELESLVPAIEIICDCLKIGKVDTQRIVENKIPISFSEKQIQTDMLSFEGFPITPSAAFKSLIHEDVATQTTKFCPDCPHICPGKSRKKFTNTASSPILFSIETIENEKNESSPKLRKSNQLFVEIEQEHLVPDQKNVEAPIETSSVQRTKSLTKQASQNPNIHRSFIESEIPVEQILEQCNTQHNGSLKESKMNNTSTNISNVSKLCGNTSSTKNKENISVIELNSRGGINTSQGSGILCSLPQSNPRVNRRLMFEKALLERQELEQNLKRVRSTSVSDSDEERPYKVKCDRFMENNLSIEFESESLQDHSQYLRNSDVLIKEPFVDLQQEKNNSFSHQKSQKKTQLCENTQADTLLNYCDELIEKANNQISDKDFLQNDNDMIMSQILSENHINSRNDVILNQSLNRKQYSLKSSKSNEKIKTQDLIKHYDDLIEKANKQIENENDGHKLKKIQYNFSQIPTSSKNVDVLEEERIDEKKDAIKTQELLDHCNSLIAKTTKEIERNEMKSLHTKEEIVQSENDDEFFCQNLDKLDSVLEKENNRELSKDKHSETLFESCKEHSSLGVENKAVVETDDMFSTPKRRRSVNADVKRKRIKDDKMENPGSFNISDDEIFSDEDVVETTPQKAVSFLERLSCSQVVNNSRTSLKVQENSENFPVTMNIVPPPPGFDDEVDASEKVDSEQIIQNSDRESENVIPNSLSPQRFEVPAKRKPLKASNSNNKIFAVPHEVPTLSQQFMKVSPICREKSKNMNVIEMVRQSKFSPLTIVPKTNTTSVLTSTPKQKSILSYVKPRLRTSQEASTSAQEKPKPCIAFTRLNHPEMFCVDSLCKKKLVTLKEKFSPEVTHMIVSVDKHNYVKDHTIKFISAIAAGIWVLNIKWVQECLSSNCVVDEEPFEVLDITGIASPRISRLTRLTNPLLEGFKFYLPRSFSQTSVEDIKNIISLQQGVVVSSIEELKNQDKYICIIICELMDTEDCNQFEDWLSSYKVVTVDINWLSLSVSRYKVLSLRPHLLCSDDSIDELNYPPNLVAEVAPSLTQDVTYD